MNLESFEQKHLLYIDNHLIVLRKPAGLLVQGDKTGDISLYDLSKEYIAQKFDKPGEAFLGIVQRLDRPVSGVIVFARTSKSAARLNEQFKEHSVRKIYRALVEGKTPESGEFEDYLIRRGAGSFVTTKGKGKRAHLSFKRLDYKKETSWVEIELTTGRHHQIRVQFASREFPLLGDFRYGSKIKFGDKALALHAFQLEFDHPVLEKRLTFTTNPDVYWPKMFK